MYTLLPLKVGECHTEEGPKMFFVRDFDKVYSTPGVAVYDRVPLTPGYYTGRLRV